MVQQRYDVAKLSDGEAVRSLQHVVAEWARQRDGLSTLAVWGEIEQARSGQPIDSWLLDPRDDERLAAEQCRKVLRVFLKSGDPKLTDLAIKAIEAAKQPRGQIAVESALIYGGIMIGLVLAARVKTIWIKKIGRMDFNKGLPPGLVKIIENAARALGA